MMPGTCESPYTGNRHSAMVKKRPWLQEEEGREGSIVGRRAARAARVEGRFSRDCVVFSWHSFYWFWLICIMQWTTGNRAEHNPFDNLEWNKNKFAITTT